MQQKAIEQQSKKSYLPEKYYVMKDLIHHAFAKTEKQPLAPLKKLQIKTEQKFTEGSSPTSKKFGDTSMKFGESPMLQWKERRNPLIGRQFS